MNRRRLIIGAGALALAGAGATAVGFSQSGSMADYAAAVAATHRRISQRPDLKDVIRLATLAANGHNTQPWRFRLGEGRIVIDPDFTRRTPVVDPDDHHLFASLGCAAETLVIAGAAAGHRGDLRFDSAGEGSSEFEFEDGPADASPLLGAITRRPKTRAEYDGRPVGVADLAALTAAARVPGVDLMLITDRRPIEAVLDLVVAGNSAQMADAAFRRELKTWLRFNPRQAIRTGDGLFSAASGNPTAPTWLGGPMFDLMFRTNAENDKYARHLRSSAGLAVFVSDRADKDHWVRSGRACQRFALQATALGLKHAFVNQPVEVAAVRGRLATYLGTGGRRPDLVMRFGYGPDLPKSLRRSVEQVILRA